MEPPCVTASVSDKLTGISPDPQPPPPPQTLSNAPPHQPVPPRLPEHPRRLSGAANTRPGEGKETPATGETTKRPEGGDSLHYRSGADWKRRRRLVEPRRPGRAHLDPDSPLTTLQLADRRSPHHMQTAATSPPPGSVAAECRATGLPQTRLGPQIRVGRAPRATSAAPRPTAALSRLEPPWHVAPPPPGHTNTGRRASPPATTARAHY
nr:proline-rich protein 2-like [Aegilops tauschii subsp. strangulata]